MKHRASVGGRTTAAIIAFGALLVSGVNATQGTLGLSAPAVAEAGEAWSLSRCQKEALKTSHELRATEHMVSSAQAAAKEAKATRLPALGVAGSYLHNTEVMKLNLPSLGAFQLPEIQFGDGNTYDLNLNARLPIFTGGALRSKVKSQEAELRAAQYDLAADSLSVIHDVRVAYFSALGGQAGEDAARLAEARLERHIEDLEKAIEVGAASEEDRIQAVAQLRAAQERRLGAEAQAASARLGLGRLVGHPGEEIRPSDDLNSRLFEEVEVEGRGVDTRPELAGLEERIHSSRAVAGVAKSSFLPSLSAELAYHYGRPGVDMVANEWTTYATIGLQLSWSLWEWGARSDRVQQAKVAGRALEQTRADLDETLRTGLAIARMQLRTAREQNEKAADRVDLQRRRLELVKGRYSAAAASESELLDAHDDLALAESDLAAAVARVRLAEVQVLYALGL
jgi:outer membrane protein